MEKGIHNNGYAADGTPVDYIDDAGIHWIYKGKREDNSDNWYGIPLED